MRLPFGWPVGLGVGDSATKQQSQGDKSLGVPIWKHADLKRDPSRVYLVGSDASEALRGILDAWMRT